MDEVRICYRCGRVMHHNKRNPFVPVPGTVRFRHQMCIVWSVTEVEHQQLLEKDRALDPSH